MRVGVVGVNHKTADLALREKMARAFHDLFQEAYIVLSTCNRTEVYFSSGDLAAGHSEILFLLRTKISFPFEHLLYAYFGGECFTHLSCVAAGLDSVILGESEIQKQVKTTYARAHQGGDLTKPLHFLFQKALKISKQVRTVFSLLEDHLTLEKMILRLAEAVCGALSDLEVLFVGNSEINRKVMAFFAQKGQRKLSLCTRAPESAKAWGQKMQISVYPWEHLHFWPRYDLIVCGTHQEEYLISVGGEMHTQLIIDLSVPRSVNPALASHPHLTLLNVEELGRMLQKSNEQQEEKIQQAGEYVRKAVERQVAIFTDKSTAPAPFLAPC